MAKSDVIEVDGVILECLPSGFFKVKITSENWPAEHAEILASASGKMRKYSIRVLPGDKIKAELSPYDLSRGRITFREK